MREPPLVPVKPEPQEASLRRRNRGSGLVINEGRRVSSPACNHLGLVKPKKEWVNVMKEWVEFMKKEHEARPADLDGALAWSKEDHVREDMELDVTRVYFLPLVGYPKWKVRCSVAAISHREDAKVEYRTNKTPIDTRRWSSEQWRRLQPRLLTSPGPAHRYR